MTNEPTTGEIVRAFRGAGVYGITTALELIIIDRLESQEHTIDELEDECGKLKLTIDLLTARAESAERERDAFVEKIKGRCSECEYEPLTSIDEPCASCHTKNGYPNWKWRRLQPQDGGGNETDYA